MKKLFQLIAGIVILLLMIGQTALAQDSLKIINARILDGTGNSWYWGEIIMANGKILSIKKTAGLHLTGESSSSALGSSGQASSNAQPSTLNPQLPTLNVPGLRVLDAKGLIASPGFIDVHAHIETGVFERPTADNYIYDGVTTVVTGNCGNSFDDIGDFFRKIDSMKTSINIATLVGHNTVRRLGMGLGNRQATPEEMKKMEDLVTKAMQDGAVGMSTGLIYLPGMYSSTEEIVDLAKIVASKGGVYATHMRNEGLKVTDAINEALTIGKQANIPVEISHFKVSGRASWGRSTETLDMVLKARLEGYDVTIDQYPYTASSTNLAVTVPDWALDGGLDSLRVRMKDKNTREKIISDMEYAGKEGRNKNYSYAVVANYPSDTTLNGKSISEINKEKGRKPKFKDEAQTILDMLDKGNAQMVYHSMNEDDVKYIMKYPFNMPAADGGVSNGKGIPHPRTYGTNARVLGRYVRELKVISLEEAVRRMTSLPAQKFNLSDRGLLREGMAADILLFDENKVGDAATFEKPHQFSVGIPYVIVNGQVVIDEGKHTSIKSGQSLRKK
jgi:N-acyl-D-amino-acid deacylase